MANKRPQKVLVVGDTHGSIQTWTSVISRSKHLDYSKIVQVGDFGIWDHVESGVKYLDLLNSLLALHGRVVYAIGGNHENWDHWNWYVEHMPKDKDGFAIVRNHIRLAPRVHGWSWYDKSFYAVAGAASIDKKLRLAEMAAGRPKQWWEQEQITDAEVAGIANIPRDYLFTHDASNRTPWGFQLVPDFDSQIHRQRIDTVLEKVTPTLHFHGHMHKRFDWMNRVAADKWTQTYGLDADATPNSWGLLDTETDTFKFGPAIY